MTSHRTRTRRATRTWQISALALAGGAAALAFSPLSKYLSEKKFVPPEPVVGGEVAVTRPMLAADKVAWLKGEMDRIAGKVAVTIPEPEPEPDGAMVAGGEPEPEPPPAPITEWVYKSYLGSPKLKAATVSVGDTQMLVCAGRTYEETKVLEVLPTHMMIEENGVQKRLDIAPRVVNGFGESTGTARPMATARPVQPGFNQSGRVTAVNNSMNAGLDQQRRAAMLAAAAAHQPQPQLQPLPPGEFIYTAEEAQARFDSMPNEQREMLKMIVTDTTVDAGKRLSQLDQLGVSPKVSVQDRMRMIEMFGINPENDPGIYEHIKRGGGK